MQKLLAAAIILSTSTFSALAGTNLYDVNNWYAIRNGTTATFTESITSDSILITSYYDSVIFCYIDPVQLVSGKTINVSGTVNLSGISTASGANTVFGLFDSKNTRTTIDTIITENNLTHGINSKEHTEEWGASVLTGSMVGFLSSVSVAYNRNKSNTLYSMMTTTSGGTKIETYSEAFSSPVLNADYDFSISLTKEDTGTYAVAFSLGNDGKEYKFEKQTNDNLEKIDLIGFKLPTTSSALAIKNLAIAVAPEPSAFGLLAGTLALVLAGTRRRRK